MLNVIIQVDLHVKRNISSRTTCTT